MNSSTCCVPGCLKVEKRLYRFPSPEVKAEHFDLWLKKINSQLLNILPRPTIYANYRVCRIHFEKQYYIGENLLASAVPTQFLPGSKSEPESNKELPISQTNNTLTPTINLPQPSASSTNLTSSILFNSLSSASTNQTNFSSKNTAVIDNPLTPVKPVISNTYNYGVKKVTQKQTTVFKSLLMRKLKAMSELQMLHAENIINQILYKGIVGNLTVNHTILNGASESTTDEIPLKGNVLILKKTKNAWSMMKCQTKR